MQKQKSTIKNKRAPNMKTTAAVTKISASELRSMSRRELLSLTRALINVRDGRTIDFSVPYATHKVLRCARKVEKMPQSQREETIVQINSFVINLLYS